MKKYILFLLLMNANFHFAYSQSLHAAFATVTNITGVDYSNLKSVIVQPDGKIIAGGWARRDYDVRYYFLLRYNPDGTLDKDFGNHGFVLTGFNGEDMIGNLLVLQSDGKIVMSGIKYEEDTHDGEMVLFRFNNDGSIDKTFGNDGKVSIDSILFNGKIVLDIQQDGKIVASAGIHDLSKQEFNFCLIRFNPNGTLDNTFASNGILKSIGLGEVTSDMKIQPDGKILAAISYQSKWSKIVRYDSNGILDHSFGSDGMIEFIDKDNICAIKSLLLKSDGKIILAGTSNDTLMYGRQSFYLTRYNGDGTLDDTFGNKGNVYTGKGLIFGWRDYYSTYCATIQQDGKIILIGNSNYGFNFIIAKYNENGTLDNTFGVNGLSIGEELYYSDVATSVVLQPDKKIVIAGYNALDNLDPTNLVARYNADGTIDKTFSDDGKATWEVKNSIDEAKSVVETFDSHLLVAGYSDNKLVLAKYDPNNQLYYPWENLDITFGNNGVVKTNIEGKIFCSLKLQSDDKIILNNDSCLLRLDIDGSLDPSFGSKGSIVLDSVLLTQTLVLPDNKIIVTGYTTEDDNKFLLVKYSPDGIPDKTFGTNGITTTSFDHNGDFGMSSILQPDGKIIVAGTTRISDANSQSVDCNFAVARYNSDGTLDNSFGSGGKIITSIRNSNDQCSSVAIQSDGKIIVSGQIADSLAVIRYNTNGDIDETFGNKGYFISSEIGHFGNKVMIKPNDEILIMVDNKKVIRLNPDGILDNTFDTTQFVLMLMYDGLVLANGRMALVGSYDTDFGLMLTSPDGFNTVKDYKNQSLKFSEYPNPIGEDIYIDYTLDHSQNISLSLYDINGRIIKSFHANESRDTGSQHEHLHIDKSIPSGNYILKLSTKDHISSIILRKI